MSVVPTPPPVENPLTPPTGGALDLVFTTLPALLRLTCGLVGAVVALSVRTAPVDPPLLFAMIALLTGWSVHYAHRALRRGVTGALVAGDVALTTMACLLIGHLVAADVLSGEGSWVALLASTSVINAQVTTRARWSIPAALLITCGYALGARSAGNLDEAVAHAATLLVQTGCTAMLATVMRRRSRQADLAFADFQRLAREAVIARSARATERQQNRDLHDTVLSTLTVVGLGAVRTPSAALRERAAADLRTLGLLSGARAATCGPTALDDRLRTVLAQQRGLPVTFRLEPCVVPAEVADALADSTAAALSNVARHAPGATTRLRLHREADAVVVELVDDGPGFDPDAVPAHRYGLRESVRGRMAELGGRAEIDSAPGRGTRVRLEWSGVRRRP